MLDGICCKAIADTILVVMVYVMPSQPVDNRFDLEFRRADSVFNQRHRIDIQLLREASREAARSAALKTRRQLLMKFKND